MAMSEGASDGLFRLAEGAAPDPGRLMPTERTYAQTESTVSLSDAILNMKKRKALSLPQIPGGLSDPSASLRKAPRNTPDKGSGKDSEKGSAGQGEDPLELLSRLADAGSNPTEKQEKQANQTNQSKKSQPKGAQAKGVAQVLSALVLLGKEVRALRDLVQSGQKDREKPEEPEDPEESAKDKLEAFRAQRHRVTFVLNGMEFTVSCLRMTRDADAHTVVLAFPADAEAFFTPPLQSELRLLYDGQDIGGKVFYFGMGFTLPELGLRFLGFLYDDKDGRGEG